MAKTLLEDHIRQQCDAYMAEFNFQPIQGQDGLNKDGWIMYYRNFDKGQSLTINITAIDILKNLTKGQIISPEYVSILVKKVCEDTIKEWSDTA
jgi:hypothetical protein